MITIKTNSKKGWMPMDEKKWIAKKKKCEIYSLAESINAIVIELIRNNQPGIFVMTIKKVAH